MSDVGWYLRRLRAMEPGEAALRLARAPSLWRWRHRRRWIAPAPRPYTPSTRPKPVAEGTAEERAAALASARNLLDGSMTVLNVADSRPLSDWLRDPQTGVVAPREFGPGINYRDPARVGNARTLWEKNRHRQIAQLAWAWALGEDAALGFAAVGALGDWIRENPFPVGVNWCSGLEAGLRLIAWVWTERLLSGHPAHAGLVADPRFWSSVYWHQWLLARWSSPGSSANNHLIGEMAGLFVAAAAWPLFPASAGWRDGAQERLEAEIRRQLTPAGWNREEAFGYHLFTLGLFWMAGIEGARAGIPFSAEYWQRVGAMSDWMSRLADCRGGLPRFGDDDEADALPLGEDRAGTLHWLAALGFGPERAPSTETPGRLAAGWLLADAVPQHLPTFPPAKAPPETTGSLLELSVHRGDSGREILCRLDAGPLGLPPLFAHGHADALQVTLTVAGQPVLVDPGTFTYHADPKAREYFRATRAHNTIEIDGRDQAPAGGPFLWGAPVPTRVMEYCVDREGGRASAHHAGYRRGTNPVMHRRTLTLKTTRIEIKDALAGSGAHRVAVRFHFHPDCTVTRSGPFAEVRWPGGALTLTLDQKLSWTLLRGEEQGGWYSPGFNLKVPAATLAGTAQIRFPVTFTHTLEVLSCESV